MNKHAARKIRAGITDGRKFVMLAATAPGLTSDDLGHDLRGIYGKAYIRTVMRSHWDPDAR